ncbi:MAG: competence/damage-inducible protein A [Eubacterium sp.]|nr:competence/damage-inducible protein A [Eubacterium sp.]
MRCAILTVGTEILFGQIVNTNAAYLSRELNLLGFDVMYHYTVGDNDGRLAEVIRTAFKDVDLIVTTGGLGPTEDDLTKETACAVLHDELAVHAESLAALERIARLRGRKMTLNNYKQAMMPTRAVVFDNDAGSAPGFVLEDEGKTILCMPGPPREMHRMWERRAKPYLLQFSTGVIHYRLLRYFGIGESSLETKLLPLIDAQTDPTLATYAKEGECCVRVASKRESPEEAKAAVDEMARRVAALTGEFIYSFDGEDYNLAVGKELIRRGLTISACESCTGGMFSESLVSVPGISAVFDRGLVTYTEKAKMEELGVKPETLEKYTAESPETAIEMARGLREKTGSAICVSSTGVAGPGPYGDKPAGLMYVGISMEGYERVREIRTNRDDRRWNRHYCVLCMFDEIRKAIGFSPEL